MSGSNDHSLKLAFLIAIILIPTLFILGILAATGIINVTDGCLQRYTADPNNNQKVLPDQLNDSKVTNVILQASGNYQVTKAYTDNDQEQTKDITQYGQWFATNLQVEAEEEINFEFSGEVSLCQAQSIINPLITMPRIEEFYQPNDKATEVREQLKDSFYYYGMPIILDASSTQDWTTIAKIEYLDKIEIRLKPTITSVAGSVGFTQTPQLTNELDLANAPSFAAANIITADCSEKQTSYNAICGRFTPYSGPTTFAASCIMISPAQVCYNKTGSEKPADNYDCLRDYTKQVRWINIPFCGISASKTRNECRVQYVLDNNIGGVNDLTEPTIDKSASVPAAYLDDGTYSFPKTKSVTDLNDFIVDFSSKQCNSINDYYQDPPLSWFVGGQGLLYKVDSENVEKLLLPISENTSENYALVYQSQTNLPIYSDTSELQNLDPNYGNLQIKFFSPNSQSGGYVIAIKQTKCVRQNGVGVAGTGQIEYVISDDLPDSSSVGQDLKVTSIKNIANAPSQLKAPKAGYLFLRVVNKKDQYINSLGDYQVKIIQNKKVASFSSFLDKVILKIKTAMMEATDTAITNITCYKAADKSSCANLFQYIHVLLTLYVILLGVTLLFAKINYHDLIIQVIKCLFIAGLMTGGTVAFFNEYLKDIIWTFSDTVISNLAGYDTNQFAQKDGQVLTSPMSFLNSLLSKVFFSKTLLGQVLATISAGIPGVFYFILVCLAIAIFLVAAFRAIAIYVLSFMGVAILLLLAPIFLVFMIFKDTSYLFDNWLNALMRYIFEPIILLSGLVILTQLFEMYLDMTLGYSVCWKCAIPIKLPFNNILSMLTNLASKPIFCINWFAPWGVDPVSNNITFSMSNFVILLIIAYCAHHYTNLSAKITSTIFAGSGISPQLATSISQESINYLGQGVQRQASNLKNKLTSRDNKETLSQPQEKAGDDNKEKAGDDNQEKAGDDNKRDNAVNDLNDASSPQQEQKAQPESSAQQEDFNKRNDGDKRTSTNKPLALTQEFKDE
jgi:type IV secretion system protein VirB6